MRQQNSRCVTNLCFVKEGPLWKHINTDNNEEREGKVLV